MVGLNKAQSPLTSGAPGGVGGGQESLGQRVVGSRTLERRSRVGQLSSKVFAAFSLCQGLCGDPPLLLSPGVVLEVQASPADHHATAAGAGASGGEDLH